MLMVRLRCVIYLTVGIAVLDTLVLMVNRHIGIASTRLIVLPDMLVLLVLDGLDSVPGPVCVNIADTGHIGSKHLESNGQK